MRIRYLPLRSARLGAGWRDRALAALGAIAALLLGVLFIWAAIYKSVEPYDATRLMDAVAPWAPSVWLVRSAVVLEWLLGVVLLVGWRPRAVALGAVVLLTGFTALLFYAKTVGFEGACGCFGVDSTLGAAIVRNALLVLLASAVYAGARYREHTL